MSDPGRHERFVTVDGFGRRKAFIENQKDVFFCVLKTVRNGLKEAASVSGNTTLKNIWNLLKV